MLLTNILFPHVCNEKKTQIMLKTFFYVSAIVLLFSCKTDSAQNQFFVTVVVDYGDAKSLKQETVHAKRDITALEALQHVAVVTTCPVASHIFVRCIDSVTAVRGSMAWYYKVNGESTGVLSINRYVQSGDTITWTYIKDVCSHTVDN